MFKRIAGKTLERLAGQFPVICIIGPRQSGKSTLAQMVFAEKKYVSFDDKNMRELASANPKDFLMAFPHGAVIDEAQKVPEIFDAVKYDIDHHKHTPGKFILTGSSQFRLRNNITDSMAGRAAFVRLLPFSITELKNEAALPNNPYDLIFNGQYPPLYDEEKHYIIEDWYDNYINTYLDLDVADQINPSNLSTFKKFIQVCALHSGQILSMDSISRDIGVSSPTVKNWLSILEASYIIHLLEADSNNLGRSLIKSPKLYFIDSGLLCHLLRLESKEDLLLDPHKGAVVESFAVSELLKNRMNAGRNPNLTYFRDKNGFEVDTIADWKHTFAIEIKSNSDAEAKLSGNTRKYIALRQDLNVQGVVFYLGDISVKIGGIQYVSWRDWGEFTIQPSAASSEPLMKK